MILIYVKTLISLMLYLWNRSRATHVVLASDVVPVLVNLNLSQCTVSGTSVGQTFNKNVMAKFRCIQQPIRHFQCLCNIFMIQISPNRNIRPKDCCFREKMFKLKIAFSLSSENKNAENINVFAKSIRYSVKTQISGSKLVNTDEFSNFDGIKLSLVVVKTQYLHSS